MRARSWHQPCFRFRSRQGWQTLNLECIRLVRQQGRSQAAGVGCRIFGWRLDRAPRGGPDREAELLQATVPVAYLPRDGPLLLLPEDPDAVSQRREIRIAADINRML